MQAGYSTFVLAVLITSILLMNVYTVPDAYGHGLGKKETEPKNVGDRIASLKVEIAPELI